MRGLTPIPTKSVPLALVRNIQEFSIGVAHYAREANWILDDNGTYDGEVPPMWTGN